MAIGQILPTWTLKELQSEKAQKLVDHQTSKTVECVSLKIAHYIVKDIFTNVRESFTNYKPNPNVEKPKEICYEAPLSQEFIYPLIDEIIREKNYSLLSNVTYAQNYSSIFTKVEEVVKTILKDFADHPENNNFAFTVTFVETHQKKEPFKITEIPNQLLVTYWSK